MAFKVSFAIALNLMLGLSGIAQTTNGLITGTVQDPTGATVPSATITVIDLGTKGVRRAISDEHGRYVIPQLPPATYSVVVSKEGFAPSERSALQVHVNEEATIDFKLTVGNSVERVEVTSIAPPLNTTSATLGDVVDHETTVDLPLNGRQFTSLTLLSPGASPVEGPQQASKTIALGAGAIVPSVSGQRPQQNNFTMDGVLNNNIYTDIWAISPPPDALDEFNVQSHITDAQFATTSRGQTSTSRLDRGRTITTAIFGSSFATTLLMPKPFPRPRAYPIDRTNTVFTLADRSVFPTSTDARTLGSQVTGKDFGPTNHNPRQRQRSHRQWLEVTFLRYSAVRWELTTLAVPSTKTKFMTQPRADRIR